MQVQDCFDANGEKIKVRDIVWSITTPLRVLKIVSQKEYRRLERERRASDNEKRKDYYKEDYEKHKKLEEEWPEKHGFPYPKLEEYKTAADFDTFEEYWEYKKQLWRDPGHPEFPENKIPMLYVSFYQRENSMECYGFWQESIKVFKNPTKIPFIN